MMSTFCKQLNIVIDMVISLRGWKIALLAVLVLSPAGRSVAGQDQGVLQTGSTFRDCSECPEMMVVPPGHFLMGSSPEAWASDLASMGFIGGWLIRRDVAMTQPPHLVTIGQMFGLGKYDVTRGEFAAFSRETGYAVTGGCTVQLEHKYLHPIGASWQNPGFRQTDRDPVVCVSWRDAKAYVAWLNGKLRDNAQMGHHARYRLPSEAEWEYAARAGQQTTRWWGDPIGINNANCDGCGSVWDTKGTAPVGSFRPNPFGLYDVLGNAWQWVEDCWNGNYDGAPLDGSAWTTGTCEQHVMRGGDWSNDPWVLRSAMRSKSNIDQRANYLGFRVAQTLR
jgi:formylglycine-generating enzyme required for sulfatase activity